MHEDKALPSGSKQAQNLFLTGRERHLDTKDIIVSKTNPQGRMTYINKTFLDISDYTEDEMLGAPHSAIRHPHMPRVVFKLLWDTISEGKEIFAYVMNRCKNGDHYWVLAHVTPCYALDGSFIGYHSNRRSPRSEALSVIRPIYDKLLEIERNNGRKEGLEASYKALTDMLRDKEVPYDKFILSI